MQVFLVQGDVDQAWTGAKALPRACGSSLLGAVRRATRLDAFPIFEDEVERLIAAKNNDAYHHAVETIAHVQKLMRAAAQPDTFGPYAAGVRARHKPKRVGVEGGAGPRHRPQVPER